MAVSAQADEVHRVISTAFDPAFYRAAYPELASPAFDPLKHYLAAGWREGRDPAPWFSTEAYLAANADVRRARQEPLFHYLTIGSREGRAVVPSRRADRYLTRTEWTPQPWSFEALAVPTGSARAAAAEPAAGDRALVAEEFDAAWYLSANPDVAAAGGDPLDHFMVAGWREGRDPNPHFSVKDYLESYPDIQAAGANPFVHYVRAGRAEGRSPRSRAGFRYQALLTLAPVAERVERLKAAAAPARPGSGKDLRQALADSRTGLKDLHVTFSHDDYTANLGGVQLCLQREDARIAELGRDHLHLYPIKPWPVVRTAGEAGELGVVWNGRRVGAYRPKAVVEALRDAASGPAGERSFAIHSLLGHTADETADILQAAGLTAGFFWLHDFASLCAGFHLLRNDVQDCAAPPPDSAACGICAYLPLRARHLAEHERLFKRLDLTVVAPSQPTLELWRSGSSYPARGEVVLPHATLVERGPAKVSRKARPFRLAYAGLPAVHKGWPIFRELALKHAHDPRYAFLHLGGRAERDAPVEFHEVIVSEARPRLMQETLEALDVDAVLVWPLCRETFSFTAYEAAAAGCAVITGPDSGNVQAFVRDSGHGRVLPDESALVAAFHSGDVAALARARRKPKLYDLRFSALTVDLVRPRADA